ncbi:hypothetical protein GPECTOR_55g294 [Gonium pectorale]|uniref:PX domain-containing protein n=1 Tax=Gonium pectorale TaxID=33097 RepID=A0A150G6D2_GONPE|nr:hypothetical protein GPECTOR_55g294 [Gonium pectorale]|eukprot:KXZ45388.1 hypothetical protein GPECTOR_55g294 [Gonium pectorale]
MVRGGEAVAAAAAAATELMQRHWLGGSAGAASGGGTNSMSAAELLAALDRFPDASTMPRPAPAAAASWPYDGEAAEAADAPATAGSRPLAGMLLSLLSAAVAPASPLAPLAAPRTGGGGGAASGASPRLAHSLSPSSSGEDGRPLPAAGLASMAAAARMAPVELRPPALPQGWQAPDFSPQQAPSPLPSSPTAVPLLGPPLTARGPTAVPLLFGAAGVELPAWAPAVLPPLPPPGVGPPLDPALEWAVATLSRFSTVAEPGPADLRVANRTLAAHLCPPPPPPLRQPLHRPPRQPRPEGAADGGATAAAVEEAEEEVERADLRPGHVAGWRGREEARAAPDLAVPWPLALPLLGAVGSRMNAVSALALLRLVYRQVGPAWRARLPPRQQHYLVASLRAAFTAALRQPHAIDPQTAAGLLVVMARLRLRSSPAVALLVSRVLSADGDGEERPQGAPESKPEDDTPSTSGREHDRDDGAHEAHGAAQPGSSGGSGAAAVGRGPHHASGNPRMRLSWVTATLYALAKLQPGGHKPGPGAGAGAGLTLPRRAVSKLLLGGGGYDAGGGDVGWPARRAARAKQLAAAATTAAAGRGGRGAGLALVGRMSGPQLLLAMEALAALYPALGRPGARARRLQLRRQQEQERPSAGRAPREAPARAAQQEEEEEAAAAGPDAAETVAAGAAEPHTPPVPLLELPPLRLPAALATALQSRLDQLPRRLLCRAPWAMAACGAAGRGHVWQQAYVSHVRPLLSEADPWDLVLMLRGAAAHVAAARRPAAEAPDAVAWAMAAAEHNASAPAAGPAKAAAPLADSASTSAPAASPSASAWLDSELADDALRRYVALLPSASLRHTVAVGCALAVLWRPGGGTDDDDDANHNGGPAAVAAPPATPPSTAAAPAPHSAHKAVAATARPPATQAHSPVAGGAAGLTPERELLARRAADLAPERDFLLAQLDAHAAARLAAAASAEASAGPRGGRARRREPVLAVAGGALYRVNVFLQQRNEDGSDDPPSTSIESPPFFVLRRYSQFRHLHEQLKSAFPVPMSGRGMAPPPKHPLVLGDKRDALERRRAELEKWLWRLVGTPELARSPQLKAFLEFDRALTRAQAAQARRRAEVHRLLDPSTLQSESAGPSTAPSEAGYGGYGAKGRGGYPGGGTDDSASDASGPVSLGGASSLAAPAAAVAAVEAWSGGGGGLGPSALRGAVPDPRAQGPAVGGLDNDSPAAAAAAATAAGAAAGPGSAVGGGAAAAAAARLGIHLTSRSDVRRLVDLLVAKLETACSDAAAAAAEAALLRDANRAMAERLGELEGEVAGGGAAAEAPLEIAPLKTPACS